MPGFAPLLLLAVAAAQAEPDPPGTLSGEDFLLIAAAARHRALRGADLACYTIHRGTLRGRPTVTFLSRAEPTTRPVPGEPDAVEIVLPPPDPDCRDTTIVLNRRREVVKVYRDLEEIDEMLDEAAEGVEAAPPR